MSGEPLDNLYDALALPPAALLNRRVAKSLLSERGDLSSADRRRVDTGLERLTWRATLKPAHAGVPAFNDDARDYAQIVVMTALLRPVAQVDRLGDSRLGKTSRGSAASPGRGRSPANAAHHAHARSSRPP